MPESPPNTDDCSWWEPANGTPWVISYKAMSPSRTQCIRIVLVKNKVDSIKRLSFPMDAWERDYGDGNLKVPLSLFYKFCGRID